ncbi:MAG TPA: zinc ribbon domain-containing protein [Bacillus sp. (in: firmicutes)]|uniref:zinc ribbon domain-containing protein n=1 Tax=Bacillus litorisediminis TaxID=2922713 RepID=UPI001FAFE900|nr:zinc ribbon domain-containing protein [Bacillus litorisediminis]HWO76550.1 zinc ribbon domain-containing protein [Bacillus sp. (in: firmicutes)]
MRKDKFITEEHKKTRSFFRILSPVFLVIGSICLVVALIDFFTLQAFEEPKYFWLFFVAMPIIFIGFVLTGFGYGGTIAKYQSRELAPVAKDTFNYLSTETTSGVKEISKAISEGAHSSHSVSCNKCHQENPIQAKFCNHCGEKLVQSCLHCGQENTTNALYCNGCGNSLV